MTYFHYTCKHGRRGIGTHGLVLPAATLAPTRLAAVEPEYRWLARLAWFTDQPVPDADALGLHAYLIQCDRTEFRYRVLDPDELVPWLDALPGVREGLAQAGIDPEVADLTLRGEAAYRPETWWVADHATRVRLDMP